MAAEVHQFTCSIPAGTAKSAPVTFAIGLSNYEVESVDIEVPPGPSGLMGFRIALNGQSWIPWEAGQWITWDNRSASWFLSDQPNLGAWSLVGYNTDVYAHEVVVRLHVNPLTVASASSVRTLTFIQQAPIPTELVTL